MLLGGGNDALWFKGGHIDGVVRGGKGDDSYYLDGFTEIAEAHNSGIDRVESSISWHLGKNFENLTLSLDTQAKLAATGNGLGNILTGNDGANAIKGLGGDDRIDGRHGADILTGGHGADTFVFMLNSGRDHVTDFTATGSNHDFIEFNGANVPYEELLLNMEQKGDDVVISLFGYDKITLEDVKLQDLTSDNFHFITT